MKIVKGINNEIRENITPRGDGNCMDIKDAIKTSSLAYKREYNSERRRKLQPPSAPKLKVLFL